MYIFGIFSQDQAQKVPGLLMQQEENDMTTKNELFEKIEEQKEKLWEMADFIFDHPE